MFRTMLLALALVGCKNAAKDRDGSGAEPDDPTGPHTCQISERDQLLEPDTGPLYLHRVRVLDHGAVQIAATDLWGAWPRLIRVQSPDADQPFTEVLSTNQADGVALRSDPEGGAFFIGIDAHRSKLYHLTHQAFAASWYRFGRYSLYWAGSVPAWQSELMIMTLDISNLPCPESQALGSSPTRNRDAFIRWASTS